MSGILAAAVIGAGARLTVSVTPAYSSGSGGAGSACPGVTAIAAGGDGSPYSFAWSNVSPDDGESLYGLIINSPGNAHTAFHFSPNPAPGDGASGVARVTVTCGAQTATFDVGVSFQNTVKV